MIGQLSSKATINMIERDNYGMYYICMLLLYDTAARVGNPFEQLWPCLFLPPWPVSFCRLGDFLFFSCLFGMRTISSSVDVCSDLFARRHVFPVVFYGIKRKALSFVRTYRGVATRYPRVLPRLLMKNAYSMVLCLDSL